jgi:hypothetical protein
VVLVMLTFLTPIFDVSYPTLNQKYSFIPN